MKFFSPLNVFLVVVIASAATFFHYKFSQEKPAANQIDLGEVKKQDLVQRVTISGQIWPKKRLDIRPPFNGYITKLYVKVGDHLKTGAPIVTFSPSLSSGETNFPIRTGFDGVVTQLWKSEGEYVLETGDSNLVVRVEDLSELLVLGSVPELDIAKIKLGLEALVRVSSLVGQSFTGKIEEIGLSAKDKDKYSSASTEFQIKVSLDSHDPKLYPGMSVIMDIITAKRTNVLTLAHEYIHEDEKGYFVVTESGERKTVTLGLQTDEAAEILSGVNLGEKVRVIDYLALPPLKN
jgi:multidrug efflux pump subunit AcrA (membrane-fusion protein)